MYSNQHSTTLQFEENVESCITVGISIKDQIFIWFCCITVLCQHLNLLLWTQMSHRHFDPCQLLLDFLKKSFQEHTAPFKLQNQTQRALLRIAGKPGICKAAHYVLMTLEQQQTTLGDSPHKPCQKRCQETSMFSDQRQKPGGSTRAAGAPVAPHCNVSIGYEPKAFRPPCCLEDINESQQVKRCKKCKIASCLSKLRQ